MNRGNAVVHSRSFEPEAIGPIVGNRHEADVEEHLGNAAFVHEVQRKRRESPAPQGSGVDVLIDSHLGKIDRENDHRQDEYRRSETRPFAVESANRDAQPATQRRERPEHDDRVPLRQPDGNQTV